LASFFSFGFSNTIDKDEEDSPSDRAESCETVNACAPIVNPAIIVAEYFIVRSRNNQGRAKESKRNGRLNEMNRSLLRSESVVAAVCGVEISRHTKTELFGVRRREAEKKIGWFFDRVHSLSDSTAYLLSSVRLQHTQSSRQWKQRTSDWFFVWLYVRR
jgi:hypothetical protein